MTTRFRKLFSPAKHSLWRGLAAGLLGHYVAFAVLGVVFYLVRPFLWAALFGNPHWASSGSVHPASSEGTVLQFMGCISWLPAGVAAMHWGGARGIKSLLALCGYMVVVSLFATVSGMVPAMPIGRALWYWLSSPIGLVVGAALYSQRMVNGAIVTPAIEAGNGYEPPQFEVNDVHSPKTPPAPPKPISITALQILGYPAIALLFLATRNSLLTSFDGQRYQSHMLLLTVWQGLALTVFVLMEIYLRKRTLVGRLLGLICIGLFTVPIWPVLLDPTVVESSVTKSALTVYGLLLLTFVPYVYWAYAVAFSRKAKRYYEVFQLKA